jgi:hypothetical protein
MGDRGRLPRRERLSGARSKADAVGSRPIPAKAMPPVMQPAAADRAGASSCMPIGKRWHCSLRHRTDQEGPASRSEIEPVLKPVWSCKVGSAPAYSARSLTHPRAQLRSSVTNLRVGLPAARSGITHHRRNRQPLGPSLAPGCSRPMLVMRDPDALLKGGSRPRRLRNLR